MVSKIGGVITISGAPQALRNNAFWLSLLETESGSEPCPPYFYMYLEQYRRGEYSCDGEVQIFYDFYTRVSIAKQVAHMIDIKQQQGELELEEEDRSYLIATMVEKRLRERYANMKSKQTP